VPYKPQLKKLKSGLAGEGGHYAPIVPTERIAPPHRRSRRRRLAGTLLSVIVAFACAGCGSSEAESSASSGGSGGKRQAAGTAQHRATHCRHVQAPIPPGSDHVPRPTLKLDPARSYFVTLETNCGTIEIKLAVKRAPRIAASFAYLVRRGFYNGLTFHRVVAGFVIQGGDPNGNGSGGPGYTVVEPPPQNLQYTRGVVAMAKAASDPAGAAGSQFFIVTGANIELPPQYALLGNVVGDQSAVSAISRVPTSTGPEGEDSAPRSPVVIDKATLTVG
jgi:peptidyl-prolyl cis-trans isomerase B (cyclophilin B)